MAAMVATFVVVSRSGTRVGLFPGMSSRPEAPQCYVVTRR
jgi:hypothetical protein